MLSLYEYSELWICLNCRTVGSLSAHGRCATCDSDSVAVADMGRPAARNDVERLERMFQAPAFDHELRSEMPRRVSTGFLSSGREERRHRRTQRCR